MLKIFKKLFRERSKPPALPDDYTFQNPREHILRRKRKKMPTLSIERKGRSLKSRAQVLAWANSLKAGLFYIRTHASACFKKQTKVCALKSEPTLQRADHHSKGWSLIDRAHALACSPKKIFRSLRYPLVAGIVFLLLITNIFNPILTVASTATWDFSDPSIYDNPSGKISTAGNKATLSSPGSANGSALNLNPASGTKADGAADFTSANKDYLTIASNSTLQTGDIDFEMGAWIYMTTKTATMPIISKWTASGNKEYELYYYQPGDRFYFNVSGDGTAATLLQAATFGSPSISTWYFIRAWHNPTTNKVYISVNNGAADSTDQAAGVFAGTSAFNIGYDILSSIYWNGRIDSAYFKKSISSTDEATALYNAGAGRTYADLTAANGLSTFQTNLTSWWDLGEESGTRMDSKGTNNLTSSAVQLINATTLNGGFETAGAGGGDVFANWTEYISGTSTINDETVAPYAGSHAARFDLDASSSMVYVLQGTVITTGKKYKMAFYAKASSGTPGLTYGDSNGQQCGATITTSYAQYTGYFTATNPTPIISRGGSSASKSIYIDNVTIESIGPLNAAGIAGGAPSEGNFAARFNGTNQWLDKTANASLTPGNNSFEIGVWVNMDSKSLSYSGIVGKSKGAAAANAEYDLHYVNSSDRFRFQVCDGITSKNISANSYGSPVVGSWNFIRAWFDSVGQTVNIQVNNGTVDSVATAGVYPQDVSSALEIGRTYGSNSYALAGRADSAYFRKAISSTNEATALYNNGKGVKYINAPSTMTSDANLISWWDLDERTGTRNDSKGTNHLTDNGTVTQGQGVGYFDGAVGKWTDLSAGTSFTQTTQTKKPTYSSIGLNGHSGALYDGVDDQLVKTNDQIGTGDLTFYAVIKPISLTQNLRIIDNSSFILGVTNNLNGHLNCLFFSSSGGSPWAYSADNSLTTTDSFVITVTRTSAGVTNMYINGTLSGTANQSLSAAVAGSTTYIGTRPAGDLDFNGYLGPILTYSSILPSVERNQVEQTLGAKYGISVATVAGTASSSIYPTLSTKNPYYYYTISSFGPTLDPASTGTLRYQLSNDQTVGDIASATWYWWSGAAWTAADKYDAYESNTAEDISAHIATFNSVTNPPGMGNTVKWRSFFVTDGIDNPILTQLQSTFLGDTVAPDNPLPAGITATGNNGGAPVPIINGNWDHYNNLDFSWPAEGAANGAVDYCAGGEEVVSGVAGYYVYFGSNASADPITLGSYQTGLTLSSTAALVSGTTYYLRIKTIDNANRAASATEEFVYKYDSVTPNAVSYIAADPAGYTSTNSFKFSWPVVTDAGGSGLAGYQYMRGAGSGDSWSATIANAYIEAITSYQTGQNLFYVRSIDVAGNTSAATQTNYYYSADPPTKPTALSATPNPADTNSITFNWTAPVHARPIVDYAYSINAAPTVENITWTGSATTTLGPDAFATIQGTNTFYILAKDDAGSFSFEAASVASTTFVCQTAAPPIPVLFSASDSSNRALSIWSITLKWNAGPGQDPATFSHYLVERSLNGVDFAYLATTASLAYIDASGLDSNTTYYYRIKAVDNAGSTSAPSGVMSRMPTGKFATPPTLIGNPTAIAKTAEASINWVNNRASSTFVRYGVADGSWSDSKGKIEAVTDHNLTISGLLPLTTYYYQVQSADEFRDYSLDSAWSTAYSFQTMTAPTVSDFSISNVRLTSGDVSFVSSAPANFDIKYGPTIDYGNDILESAGSYTQNHNVKIENLNPGTEYHVKAVGVDQDGNSITSDDYIFSTLAMPKILNLKITPDYSGAQVKLTVSWKTNVGTSSSVNYKKEGESAYKEVSQSDFVTEHSILIENLEDNSTYLIFAFGTDAYGNIAESGQNVFVTPFDTRPPQISSVSVETSNVGLGQKDTAQIAVSWKTDEVGTSQVEYAEGISGSEYTKKTQEDATLTNSHLVIISDLTPGKPYHLRVSSKDKGGNLSQSGDYTVISSEVPRSILQIILKVLNNIFGWMGGLVQ